MASYVGNEKANLYEVANFNTDGQMKHFLKHVAGKNHVRAVLFLARTTCELFYF